MKQMMMRNGHMANLSSYWTPTIAVLAAAASLASAATAQRPATDHANQLTDQEKKAGWTLLFNGTTLDGWRSYKGKDASRTRWKVEDGFLSVAPDAARIRTARATSSRPTPTIASS